jgi:uncharacterized damage-inducible protein DinB
MKLFFEELFGYNHAMNQKLIASLDEHRERVPERSVKLVNHILNAQQVWNNRINPGEDSCGVWEIRSFAELRTIDDLNNKRSCFIVKNYDFAREIAYTNSKGQAFKNTVRDILFHIINHSTYHRAQIATGMKQIGLEPLISDYIFYKR